MSALYGFVGKVEDGRIIYTCGSTWLPVEVRMYGAEYIFGEIIKWFASPKRQQIAEAKDIDGWLYADTKDQFVAASRGLNYCYLLDTDKKWYQYIDKNKEFVLVMDKNQ